MRGLPLQHPYKYQKYIPEMGKPNSVSICPYVQVTSHSFILCVVINLPLQINYDDLNTFDIKPNFFEIFKPFQFRINR